MHDDVAWARNSTSPARLWPRSASSRTAIGLGLALVLTACGGSEKSPPRPVRVALSVDAGGAQIAYRNPVVTSEGRGDFVATMKAEGNGGRPPARMRLTGLGFPGYGEGGGRRFVGPGADLRWNERGHGRYEASIGYQGSRLSLTVWSRGGSWRVRVDGKRVRTATSSAGSDFAEHTLDVRFAPGSKKRHIVDFELAGGAWLTGVRSERNGTFWLPPARESRVLYWLGDSYFTGTGARLPGYDDLVHQASARLGVTNVVVDALGGTGYLKSNGIAKFPNYVERARANVGAGRIRPDIIVVGGSINDAQYAPADVRRQATRLYAQLARAAPGARIVVVPFTSTFPVPDGIRALNAGVLEAARSARDVSALDLPAAATARGDASTLQGADFHPSSKGHGVYGRLIADRLAELVDP